MSARVSQKPLVQTSPDFLCMLPVAMARCFCDNSATRYVLPVLWMMSCLHIMARQRRRQWVVCLVTHQGQLQEQVVQQIHNKSK